MIRDEVLLQAAEWFAVLNDARTGASQRHAWQDWMARDAEHRRAWARVESIDAGFSSLPAPAVKSALHAVSRRQVIRHALGLAAATPALWIASRLVPFAEWRADHRTVVGETRQIVLPDGGQLWLDTDSVVDLQYGLGERRIVLLAGAMLLETGHGGSVGAPLPPLVVQTAAGEIRPLGTRFSVREREAGIAVQVFAGSVALQPLRGDVTQVLVAGHAAEMRADGVAGNAPARLDAEAWTRGMLLADGMRLDDFLGELGRYRRGIVSCTDDAASLRLVGAFPLDDTGRVLAALENSLPVKVRYRTRWWVEVAHR